MDDFGAERLVHGPLTALMLLEATMFHHPDIKLKSFQYRAMNPLVVNVPVKILGTWDNKSSISVWCVNEYGTVGMTGKIGV
jgi:hydroxyacyl-ACP dehydratase HTD2-like protein with hotdog domain